MIFAQDDYATADYVDGEDGTDVCDLTWASDHDSGCEHIGWYHDA